jgi:hypothetical protein
MMDAVMSHLKSEGRIEHLGFRPGEYGDWHAENCYVSLYMSCGEWEVFIKLPNGSCIGCDVPPDKLAGRTASEIEQAEREQAKSEQIARTFPPRKTLVRRRVK